MKYKIICLFISLFLVVLSDSTKGQETFNGPLSKFSGFPPDAIYQDTSLSPSERAGDIIKHLTFGEILKMIGGTNNTYIPGLPRLGLRSVSMSDASQGIHLSGRAAKSEISTSFPAMLALASTWNPKLAYAMGKAIGEECRAYGIDILLGPGINLERFSVGGRNFEYLGEDPVLTSQMAVGYVQGLQSKKVIGTAKHFIGNDQEFCRHIANSEIDERTLREIYLPPWKAVIEKAGIKAVMTGNNAINGIPCSMNKPLVNDVLRNEFGFSGIVMTDWQNTCYFPDLQYLFPSSGVSLLMAENTTFVKYLKGYLAEHPEKKEAIRKKLVQKVYHNLLPLFEMGVYDRGVKDREMLQKIPEHRKVALQIAEEAICLLKNENHFLPLSGNKTVLLTGSPELHSGTGSGFVEGYDHVDFADGLKAVFREKLEVAENPGEEQIKKADVIIYRLNKEAGEGKDIPFKVGLNNEIAKIAAINPNILVVVSSCNGLPMPWLKKVKAVLWCYYLGQERGEALANVLIGKVNPSGKLPFTLEKDFQDCQYPKFNYLGNKPYWCGDNNCYKQYWLYGNPEGANGHFKSYVKPREIVPDDYRGGIFMGYRWYDKKGIDVRFPFGYGLSYTTFAYDNLNIEKRGKNIVVSFNLKNTGNVAGDEIAQVYVTDNKCSVERPLKELKGFKRVSLVPGEAKKVELTLKPDAFKFWDEATRQWKLEPGIFNIKVGASSRDIRLNKDMTL